MFVVAEAVTNYARKVKNIYLGSQFQEVKAHTWVIHCCDLQPELSHLAGRSGLPYAYQEAETEVWTGNKISSDKILPSDLLPSSRAYLLVITSPCYKITNL